MTIPQYAHQGTWQLSIEAADNAGNTSTLSSGELEARGFPASIEQTGAADTTPPAIISGSIEPNVIDTELAAAPVEVHMHITDPQSGTAGVLVTFVSNTATESPPPRRSTPAAPRPKTATGPPI